MVSFFQTYSTDTYHNDVAQFLIKGRTAHTYRDTDRLKQYPHHSAWLACRYSRLQAHKTKDYT